MKKLLSELRLEWGPDLPALSQMMIAIHRHRGERQKVRRGVSQTSALLAAGEVNPRIISAMADAGLDWRRFERVAGADNIAPPDIDPSQTFDPELGEDLHNAIYDYFTNEDLGFLDSVGLTARHSNDNRSAAAWFELASLD